MAKQLNVDLSVRANVSNAKAQIEELRTLLNQISTTSSVNVDPHNMAAAAKAAQELSLHLNRAYNATTGNFDLSKLDKSLKMSKTNVQDLSNQLLKAGSMGEQAFVKLAQSIASADRPMIGLNAKLKEFGTTLANTARWQLSSSMLHGFMGAVQSAYGYAQDLNESLNNIRIVTGQNSEQMAEFAVNANKAAKALSTTTTAYTDAALIYYQQGDTGSKVMEKANVTVKMANVVGKSAQDVSDQLTAVWNNFAKGGENLEYYADVMTALGAATASSSDEIAQGLEKFASVSETVGLSYEYATSALATVTATTRQSADVVGTAFKTLFARLQDLKLGETLEDGTTLGTYSQNLAKVGVDIKTASGELKDMDTILEETAAKWQTLDKDQQVALAKGVAGIRQYNTFMALMDNWDFMERNLQTAQEAGGTLSEQADIYAESWEAANNRVKASAQAIYDQLLDDEFFIDITDGFSSLLDSVSAFIDGLGGVKPLLIGIASIFLSNVAGKIEPALRSLGHSFSVVFQSAATQSKNLADKMNETVNNKLADDKKLKETMGPNAGFKDSSIVALDNTVQLNKAKANLLTVEKNLTSEERERYEQELGFIQLAQQEAQLAAEKITKRKEEIALLSDVDQSFDSEAATESVDDARGKSHQALIDRRSAVQEGEPLVDGDELDALNAKIIEHSQRTEELKASRAEFGATVYEAYAQEMQATEGSIQSSEKMYTSLELLGDSAHEYYQSLEDLNNATWESNASFEEQSNSFNEIKSEIELLAGDAFPELEQALKGMAKPKNMIELREQISKVQKTLVGSKIPAKELDKILKKMGQGANVTKLQQSYKSLGKEQEDLVKKQQQVNNAVKQFNPQHQVKGIEAITRAASGLGSVAMAAQSVRSVFQAWSNDDLSFGEKLTTTIMSLSMALPMLRSGLSNLGTAIGGVATAVRGNLIATAQEYIAVNAQEVASMSQKAIAQKFMVTEDQAALLMARAKILASKENLAAMNAETLAQQMGITTEQAAIIISALKAGKTKEEALAEAGLTVAKKGGLMATLSNIAAKVTETVTTWAKTMADKGETAGVWAKVAAYIAAQAAAWPVLVVTLLIVAAIAALAAIIALVVVGINAMSDAYNADAIAAENAENAAKNLAEAYEDAKSKYEDMISAMDKYESARNALKELTKGTDEYNQALQEANNAALELMQNYPEYFGEGDYTWQDGELIVSEEAMANAKKQENAKVQNAFAASNMATAGAKQARAVADQTALRRQIRDDNGVGDGDLIWQGIGSTLLGGLAGGLTALIPGIGAVLAPTVGTLVTSAIMGGQAAKKEAYDDAVNKSLEVFSEDENLFSNQGYLAEKMAEVGVTNTELIQALWDNRDSLTQLGQDFSAAAMQMKVAAENVANSLVQSNEKVQESGEASAVAAVSAKAYEQAYKREQEAALADIKDRGWFNTGTDKSKDLMAEYAKISGLDKDSNYEVTNYVGDGSVMVKKTLEDGSVEEVKLTAEEIAATVAADRANQQINASMETVMNDMVALNKRIDTDGDGIKDSAADKSDQALRDFLMTGKLEDASKGELEELQKEVIVRGDGTVLGDAEALAATAAHLDETLSGSPADYGYGSWLEMAEALTKAAEKTEEAWNNIELPEGLENIADLSLDAAKKIQEDMESLSIGSQGAEGIKTYTEGINQLTASMSEAQKNQFMNEIGNIDWSSWYAMDDVTALLDGMGAELNMTTEELEAFTNAMRIAGGASPTEMLAKTKSNIEALGATLSEGIAPGSVLDEETYKKLIEANKELEGQFMKTIDGSMKYVGSEEIGLEALDMGEYLETTREMHDLYENAKDDAADMDFKGLSTIDYNFADEIAAQEKMINDAQAARDKAAQDYANSGSWYTLGIGYTSDAEKTDLANKDAAIASSKTDLQNMKDANDQAKQALADSLGSVLGSDDLMAVAEYCNYTEEQLTQMQENVKAGNEDAIKEAQEFNRQMNIFMAAGANGDYNISEAEEQIASTATSIEELDALTEKYQLSAETYSKAISGLFADAAAGAKTLEELDEVKKKVEDAGGTVADSVYLENVKRLTEESMNAAKSIEDLNKAKNDAQARGAEVDMELYAENVRRVAEECMGAADSLNQLQAAWSEAAETGVELDYNLYADNLLRLAESYSICTDEARAFQTAMQSGNEEAIKAAEENLEATLMLGEAAEEYGFEADELSIQSKQLAKEYGLTAKEAAKLAIENQRMNKGVETLVENWEEWGEELRAGNKTSRDWAKAAAATTKAIADLVGASEDLELPEDFFDSAHNLELIDQAAKGSVEAINELGVAVAAAQVQMINFQEGMRNANGELIDMSQFTTWKDTVMSGITELQNSLDGIGMGDNVYEKLGGENWVAALNEMAIATGMSVEQMNSLLNSMGVQAEVEVKSVKQKMTVPTYTEVVEPTNDNLDVNGDGVGDGVSGYRRYTIPGEPQEVEGYVQVAQVKASESDLGSPEIKFTGNGNVSNSATKPSGGGGSSKKTSEARQKKSDMVDRYKEVDDKIDDTQKKMDEASKAADRLWGPSRLAQMKKVNSALEEEIDHLKDKRKEAEAYLKQDKADLNSAASALGISFSYDDNGNISNYEAQMTSLYAAREAMLDSFGEQMSESEQEKLDAFDKKVDALKDAISQYDETRELSEDLATEIQDKIYEWQDNNYEELNIELEYKLEINESKMEVIDYYMGKLENDVYATAEAFAYMSQQTELYNSNLAAQEQYVKDLTAKYEAGEISLQAYKEGLASSQSEVISNLQSLEETKQAMQDYYGNVMDMAIEQITIYTDEMENLNSVLDHYSSIMDLVGKQEDFATKNKILKSKANNIKSELQVQKELYEKSAAEAQKWAEKMATAVEGSNEYETYKKNWQAAQAAANDAQDAMLSKTEEWAEAMKSIIENELAEMADTLEKSLTGGVSFDELLTSMERRSSLQEEYLTTTNQIYETNKMMRAAQQEIDKTSNTVAKKKLQSFINETNQLQNQTKLSQYELDIQQAKYDLLLAEIALQEAQDAKSTVRLQRDAEGNFGYVYTADASQVADAEQKLADAQNNLYNIGLEGANDYQQKYAETLQESQDAITELTQMWMNGEIASEEEFNRRKQEITEYYGEKLKQYSELHTIALSADSRVLTDAWSSDFIERTASVEEWKNSVDGYFEGAAGSMATWAQVTKEVLADSGLNDMDKALGGVDTKSKALLTTLLGEDGKSGVVGAMMSEVDAAGKVSEAHITIQNDIDKTITYYENLLTAINNAHTAMTTPVTPAISTEGGTYTPPSVTPPSTTTTSGSSGSGNSGGSGGSGGGGGTGYNNGSYDTETVKKAQRFVGATADGKWGPKSAAAAAAKGYNSLAEVVAAMNAKNGSGSGGHGLNIGGGLGRNLAYVAMYDTGGYTGDWAGSYGKLAMLHKKELILKEGDTENFLASMELLERILSIIDLQSANAQLGGMLSSPSYGNHTTETAVEQNVHIEASFPGVSDRNELQEAFTNLINQASQYANRK